MFIKKVHLFLLTAMLLVGVSNAFGETYRIEQTALSSVEAGKLYVFMRNSLALYNTVSSSALQTTLITSTILSSTTLSKNAEYVWTLETAEGGYYLRNMSLDQPYLNNSSSTNMSFGVKSSIWTFSITNNVATIKSKDNTRFIGDAGGDSPNNTYKAYAVSGLKTYKHEFTIYQLVATSPIITTQPTNSTYVTNATASELTVSATSSGGDLTYQWYSNTTKSTDGATSINGATSATYVPSTANNGTTYYYCVVSDDNGSEYSDIISVVVSAPVDPVVTTTAKTINPDELLDVSEMVESESEGAFTYSIIAVPEGAEEGTDYSLSSSEFTSSVSGNYTLQIVQAAAGRYNSITVTETITVRPKCSITIITPDNGTLVVKNGENELSSGDLVVYGTVLTIEATPNTHYNFTNWQYKKESGSWNTRTANFSYTVDENVSFKANFTAKVYHKAIFSVSGNTSYVNYEAGEAIDFPSGIANIGNYAFVGWLNDVIEPTAESPELITSATMGNNDITYYAVFVEVTSYTPASWTETALASLTSTDVFVFSDGTYALNNDNGTSTAPSANAITVVDRKITSTVADNLKWNVTGNATDGYTFYPNGVTTKWLYCNTTSDTDNNNNIRVGTGARKLWILDGSGYLVTKDTYVTRYLSIYYDTPDFRSYINTNNNPIIPKFYKYIPAVIEYGNYCTSVPSVSVSLTQNSFVTYCFPIDVDINTNVVAYYTTLSSDDETDTHYSLVAHTITSGTIKAGEGVLLYTDGESGSYQFAAATSAASKIQDNALFGTLTSHSLDNDSTYYVLGRVNSVLGFYRYTKAIPANKAYFRLYGDPTLSPSVRFIMTDENTTTEIEAIKQRESAVKFFKDGQLFIRREGVTYDVTGKVVK